MEGRPDGYCVALRELQALKLYVVGNFVRGLLMEDRTAL